MSPPVVLIIGAGISGPVLGNFFKRKGYHPIVFDKVPELGDAGASLMLHSNGVKVLDLVDLADAVKSESIPIKFFHDETAAGDLLGENDLPSTFPESYGQPSVGVKRTSINLALKKMLIDMDIEVREGWELIDFREDDESVTAVFNGGREVKGSFLIGCDGIKSATRSVLIKLNGKAEGLTTYTGMTQTAGFSKTPAGIQKKPAMRNWYGDGVHFISYPVSATHTSWAITQRETIEKEETWRPYTESELPEQKKQIGDLLSGFHPDVLQLATEAERIIKFGLFDRETLQAKDWHSKRCVLVGDAAHPTSPHLGQGANQALEDCFHLSHSMPFLNPESKNYQKSLNLVKGPGLSEVIFRPFAGKRQPRTSELVKGARAHGEARIGARGEEAVKKRNEGIRLGFLEPTGFHGKWDNLLREPFLKHL